MAKYNQTGVIVVDSDKVFNKIFNNLDMITEDFVDDIAGKATDVARYSLNEAQTNFGRERYARGDGASAGRNRSGAMINGLTSRKYKKGAREGRIAAYTVIIGWFTSKDYFKYQENGTGTGYSDVKNYDPGFNYGGSVRGGIAGAHSLWGARKWISANATTRFGLSIAKFLNR